MEQFEHFLLVVSTRAVDNRLERLTEMTYYELSGILNSLDSLCSLPADTDHSLLFLARSFALKDGTVHSYMVYYQCQAVTL